MIKIIDALSALEIKDFVVYGNPKNETEFIKMFRKVIGKEENANTILSEDPNSFGVTWSQVAAKKLELEAAEPMRILRIERDKKLQESDWRTNNDYPYADADAWATYRTALRNLPAEIAAGNVTAPTIENNSLIFNDWPEVPA
tara:strand:+ start:1653 stop:2081 length:429 start_codon:yes stop_codon:yes gene_type:complete